MTFVYSIDISNEILQEFEPRRDGGAVELADMYGVLFTQALNGGDFYFNDSWVAGLPASSKSERWSWYAPLVVPLPPQLIRSDGRPNILTVSQTTHELHKSITQPYFGHLNELQRVDEIVDFYGDTLAAASATLCLVAGVFLLDAWVASPKEQVYALAGAASLLWAFLLTLARWNHLDLGLYDVWRWTIYSLAHALVCLMSMLVLSFANHPCGRWGRNFMISMACLGPIVFAVLGKQTEAYINMISVSLLLMFYVYANARLAEYCVKRRDFCACVLLLQSIVCLTLAIHDYMALTGLINFFERQSSELTWGKLLFDSIYLSHLGAPLHLVVMGYILLGQHKKNIEAVQNRESFLESSILEHEFNFKETYQQLALASRSEGAAIERERIYQDVHDGIGSQLVKAIFTLHNSGPSLAGVKHNLQACLKDLRLVIDANYESVVDVQAAVFAFCQAQEEHLEGSGLTINYDVGVESTIYFDDKTNLNVLRILQETLTNTIKHSDASEIFVEVKTKHPDLLLTITDCGHNASINRSNKQELIYGKSNQKGMASIASRAEALGGTYSINITQAGTQVSLAIPLPKKFPSRSELLIEEIIPITVRTGLCGPGLR